MSILALTSVWGGGWRVQATGLFLQLFCKPKIISEAVFLNKCPCGRVGGGESL